MVSHQALERCCACDRPTRARVTFLGNTMIAHVPCCDGCQANMTESVRFALVRYAWRHQQERTARMN